MDTETKAQLLAAAIQGLGMPLVQAGVNHRFEMERLERQEEMEMKVAERRAQGVRAMAQRGGARPAPGRQEPVALENPGDVYDELEALRAETDCGFCHQVIDSLMDAPPAEAKDGYEEIRSYVREAQRIENQDISQKEAEQIVSDLIDTWDTVPRYAAGMA